MLLCANVSLLVRLSVGDSALKQPLYFLFSTSQLCVILLIRVTEEEEEKVKGRGKGG